MDIWYINKWIVLFVLAMFEIFSNCLDLLSQWQTTIIRWWGQHGQHGQQGQRGQLSIRSTRLTRSTDRTWPTSRGAGEDALHHMHEKGSVLQAWGAGSATPSYRTDGVRPLCRKLSKYTQNIKLRKIQQTKYDLCNLVYNKISFVFFVWKCSKCLNVFWHCWCILYNKWLLYRILCIFLYICV